MIRKATLEDINNIANIELKSGYKWGMNKTNGLKEAKKIINEVLTNPKNYCCYILEKNNQKIGYFSIHIKKNICYIGFFAVKKSYHRKGFGKLLMKKIIMLANQNKCKSIELSCWAKNFSALRLYNKFSFYITDIKRKHYPNGDDKLMMEKKLK